MGVSVRARDEFIATLHAHTGKPLATCQQVGRLLMRQGATYKRLQEAFCDIDMGDEEEKYRFHEQLIERRITQMCLVLDCQPIFSGDPRGATVKLKMPDGYTNDWGATGVCVPTS